MATQCRSSKCTVERKGFRRELDSWRHKLIHCVEDVDENDAQFRNKKPHTMFSEMFVYDKQFENEPDFNDN